MDFILVLIVLYIFSFSNIKLIELGRYVILVYYFYVAYNYYVIGIYSSLIYLTEMFMLLFFPKIIRVVFILKRNHRHYQQ